MNLAVTLSLISRKRGVGYIRVSSRGQKDGWSLDEQARQIALYAEQQGYELVAIFRDIKSAKDTNRPALQAMLQFILDNHADGLVVYKFDRWSREVQDSERLRKRLQTSGKMLLSVTEPFDLATPDGVMVYQMMQSVAQRERHLISERTQRAKAAAAARGSWTGHGIPTGYVVERSDKVKRLVKTEQAHQVERLIKRMTGSTYDVANWLNELNAEAIAKGKPLPYPTAKGAPWSNVMVWRIKHGKRAIDQKAG